MQITIVIPTYNEAENLPKLVSALFYLPLIDLKVVIVDDNSPDGTGEIARTLVEAYSGKVSLLSRSGKLGLGPAYVTGFRKALQIGADAIGQMDADFSHSPEKIIEFLQVLRTCDVVMGSRYIPGGNLDETWPFWRKGLSKFGNFYARTILGLPIKDVTGGFRVWKQSALVQIPLEKVRSNGYVFQIEMAYLAHKMGLDIQEVPIYFADRRWGKSKMSFAIQLEAAWKVWRLLWDYRNYSHWQKN